MSALHNAVKKNKINSTILLRVNETFAMGSRVHKCGVKSAWSVGSRVHEVWGQECTERGVTSCYGVN